MGVPRRQLRQKHIPQRTCVGCRETQSKKALIRIVRQESGVFIDLLGKMQGRGAYLHKQKSCWEQGIKVALTRALKVPLKTEDIKRLNEFALTLTDE